MKKFNFPPHLNRPKQKSIQRWDLSQSERIGVSKFFRRDLYFRFMEATWLEAFFAFFILFLVTNVLFALAYLIDPGGVSSTRPGNFSDAFFFSVQTLTTIGFGTMSPQTLFTNIIVTVESAIGLLGVAICTGVFFAKASKPAAKVLFSKPAVIRNENGLPTLMFRVGNTRGNEIVEAEMSLTALIEVVRFTVIDGVEIETGKTFRKLQDLKLIRKRSPIFTLSWTVMHHIDEDSPLYGMTDDNIETRLVGIICALMGYDSTYGQHVHSRHLYYPDQIYFDRDFEDIISVAKNGRISVDYRKFHDTHPSNNTSSLASFPNPDSSSSITSEH